MIRLVCIVFACTAFGIVGCGSSATTGNPPAKTNALVGTWEGTDASLPGLKLVFTFTDDGKVTQDMVIEGMPKDPNVTVDDGKQEGTYKQDDKTITVTIKGTEKKMTIKEQTAAKMVLTNSQGKDMTFTKK